MTQIANEQPCCRAPRPEEYAAARQLLAGDGTTEPYAARAFELLETAASGSSEYRVIVAVGAESRLTGVGIYGLVAGAKAAGVIHSVIGRSPTDVHALIDAMLSALESMRARFAVTELADERSLQPLRAILLAHGFREESRVPDLYREGIALAFLRRDLAPGD
jgi:hypothetical protein